jgi:hypothetical protein
MYKPLTKFIFICSSVLLVGCASPEFNPMKEANFEKYIYDSTDKAEGDITYFHFGYVHLDRNGFSDTRLVRTTGPAPDLVGILVFTKKNIVLKQWSKEKLVYRDSWKLPIKEISSMSVEKYGLNRRISICFDNDKYVSLSMSSGNFISLEETQKAFSILEDTLRLKVQ